jgi:hypothetical protein
MQLHRATIRLARDDDAIADVNISSHL